MAAVAQVPGCRSQLSRRAPRNLPRAMRQCPPVSGPHGRQLCREGTAKPGSSSGPTAVQTWRSCWAAASNRPCPSLVRPASLKGALGALLGGLVAVPALHRTKDMLRPAPCRAAECAVGLACGHSRRCSSRCSTSAGSRRATASLGSGAAAGARAGRAAHGVGRRRGRRAAGRCVRVPGRLPRQRRVGAGQLAAPRRAVLAEWCCEMLVPCGKSVCWRLTLCARQALLMDSSTGR